MKMKRVWAMPSKHTFTIKPIAQLLKEEVLPTEGFWLDPFCGENSPAEVKNDLNPDIEAEFHEDALSFLIRYPNDGACGVLFDPPYSPRQISECYKSFGMKVTMETTQNTFYSQLKDEIARVVRIGGKVICFGWNSMGIGKNRGFEMERILLVPHGGNHNDTIVTVETRVR